ncbi:MAG: lipoprotein [Spiroplasma phoeniceum]|nr:MAG: lipoprotein [Spiroplasma phoeniceum]UZQ33132.1 MAG: lipoprotein [Spiroplasma phoeniceum]
MKRLLSIIGAISLAVTSTTSLVACNTPQEYTKEELKELKDKNNITTKDGILEWIAPQEKPFNTVDNKYYYVVCRGDKNDNWIIVNYKYKKQGLLEEYNNFILSINNKKELYIFKKQGAIGFSAKWNKNNDYFKSVYRWNLDTNISNLLYIDENGNIKVK